MDLRQIWGQKGKEWQRSPRALEGATGWQMSSSTDAGNVGGSTWRGNQEPVPSVPYWMLSWAGTEDTVAKQATLCFPATSLASFSFSLTSSLSSLHVYVPEQIRAHSSPFLIHPPPWLGALIQSLAINTVYMPMAPKFILSWTSSSNFRLCLSSYLLDISNWVYAGHLRMNTCTEARIAMSLPRPKALLLYFSHFRVNFILIVA